MTFDIPSVDAVALASCAATAFSALPSWLRLEDDSGLAPLKMPESPAQKSPDAPSADSVARFQNAMAGAPRFTPAVPAALTSLVPAIPATTPSDARIAPVSPEQVESLAPARFFTAKDGTVLPYREYIPAEALEESGKAGERILYPLVLFMHGAGTRGSDGAAFANSFSFKCLLSKVADESPDVVAAPQVAVNAPQVADFAPAAVAMAPSNRPDVVAAPQVAVNAPQAVVNAPQVAVNAPQVVVNAPQAVVNAPQVADFAPAAVVMAPSNRPDVVAAPQVAVNAPQVADFAPAAVAMAPSNRPDVVAAPQVAANAPQVADFAPATDRVPAIVIAPQCPENAKWVDTPWEAKAHAFNEAPSRYMAAALELFDRELAALPVDRSRIYVCGSSMGGYATWDILCRRPDVFAAALPVCGGGTPEIIVEASRTTPVLTVHGSADDTVPVENTRAIAAAVGADPRRVAEFRYIEKPGVGHDCWTETFSDPKILDWLLTQKREIGKTREVEEQPQAIQAAPVSMSAPVSAAPVQDAMQVSASADAARTAVIAETVNQVAEAVAAQIQVNPSLVRGEGDVKITLKPTVLDGSEIRLTAKDGTLTVALTPATPEAERIAGAALPRLEEVLAAHAPAFRHVTVSISALKKGRMDETP